MAEGSKQIEQQPSSPYPWSRVQTTTQTMEVVDLRDQLEAAKQNERKQQHDNISSGECCITRPTFIAGLIVSIVLGLTFTIVLLSMDCKARS